MYKINRSKFCIQCHAHHKQFSFVVLFSRNNAFLFYFTPHGLKQLLFSRQLLFNEYYKAVVAGRIGVERSHSISHTIIHHFGGGVNSTRGYFLGYNTVAYLFSQNTVSGEAGGHIHKCADYLKCQIELQTMHFQAVGLLLAPLQKTKSFYAAKLKDGLSGRICALQRYNFLKTTWTLVFFSKYEYKYICLSEGWWIKFSFVLYLPLDCLLYISALQIKIWLIVLYPYL